MIWRLMATILVMSDTGSVSLVATHTDWPDETSCRQILQSHYTPPPDKEFNGHKVTAKISASCVPVDSAPLAAHVPPSPQAYGPPPVANVVPRFFNELGQRMLAPPCGGRLPCDYN
jgi:hypothetical protein